MTLLDLVPLVTETLTVADVSSVCGVASAVGTVTHSV
jgi:hypothetical protein